MNSTSATRRSDNSPGDRKLDAHIFVSTSDVSGSSSSSSSRKSEVTSRKRYSEAMMVTPTSSSDNNKKKQRRSPASSDDIMALQMFRQFEKKRASRQNGGVVDYEEPWTQVMQEKNKKTIVGSVLQVGAATMSTNRGAGEEAVQPTGSALNTDGSVTTTNISLNAGAVQTLRRARRFLDEPFIMDMSSLEKGDLADRKTGAANVIHDDEDLWLDGLLNSITTNNDHGIVMTLCSSS